MEDAIKKYQKHIMSAFGIGCSIYNIRERKFENSDSLFCLRCRSKCDFKNTHLYGCYEAMRWDNKYIYCCPCGYQFIAIPVPEEQTILYTGVITGPILVGEPDDVEAEEYGIPICSPGRVNDIAELISAVFVPKFSLSVQEELTGDLLNTIYKELEVLPEENEYPIELEKQLQMAVIERDEKSARDVLNHLLGQVFFHSNGDLKIIKARVLELIVLLSRAAIEGGADANQIFNLNNNYIIEVEEFKSLESLSFWLTGVLGRFVSYVFEFGDVKHADTIYKVTTYIKNNYMKKLSLDDIAERVFLSKSYLSKIFNEEMNIPISTYINKVRIENGKLLLQDPSLGIAEIANLVGFEDQSYFTKTFKNIAGISPGKYREKHISI